MLTIFSKTLRNRFKIAQLFNKIIISRTSVDIGNEEKKAIGRVLNSGQFVKGQEASTLEK